MSRGRLVFVWGTRPEALKIGPVVASLRELGVEPTLIATGQHTDLLKGTPAETDLASSTSLNLPSAGDITKWLERAVPELIAALDSLAPIACVVVQGDTMSAYAGALAAKKLALPLAHVEAGLRSFRDSDPWPEEIIRKQITRRADLHFAPTAAARRNLYDESVPPRAIHLTGNSIVSAIARYTGQTHVKDPENHILVTLHRREWLDHGPDQVNQMLDSLIATAQAHPDTRFTWPMHPNVKRIATPELRILPLNLDITPPLPYPAAISTLAHALGVITDSGGLQEEAAILGTPACVLRNASDRPESLNTGVAQLLPPIPASLPTAANLLTSRKLPRLPIPDYGLPDAADRIARVLSKLP